MKNLKYLQIAVILFSCWLPLQYSPPAEAQETEPDSVTVEEESSGTESDQTPVDEREPPLSEPDGVIIDEREPPLSDPGDVVRESLSIEDYLDLILIQIPQVIDLGKSIVEDISEGNIGDLILTTVGLSGLIDPQEEAREIRTSDDSPYSDPRTPEQVAKMGRGGDDQQSQILQRLSSVVFGEEGQAVTAEQNETIEDTQQGAILSQESLLETTEISQDIFAQSGAYAGNIEELASEAQAAKASQDVLKAIASQNRHEAKMNEGLSEQLALIAESQMYNGVHLQGLNTQLTVMNKRKQNSEMYQASQILQLAEIDSNLEQQLQRDKQMEEREAIRSQVGMTKVYIPGLFRVGDED